MAENRKPHPLPRRWEAEYAALLTAVGAVVTVWGGIERQVNNCVTAVYVGIGGRDDDKRRAIPGRPLGPKLRFLKACFRRVHSIRDLQPEALSLFDEIGELADIRHALVHGDLESHKGKRSVFYFTRLELCEEGYRRIAYSFNLKSYSRMLRRFAAARLRAARLAAALMEISRKQHLEAESSA